MKVFSELYKNLKHVRGALLLEAAFVRADRVLVCFLAAVVLAGCASRPINEPITQVDP
jgi:hypothetical protein